MSHTRGRCCRCTCGSGAVAQARGGPHVEADALLHARLGQGGGRVELEGQGGAGGQVLGVDLLHWVPTHLPAVHHVGAPRGAAVAHRAGAVAVPGGRRERGERGARARGGARVSWGTAGTAGGAAATRLCHHSLCPAHSSKRLSGRTAPAWPWYMLCCSSCTSACRGAQQGRVGMQGKQRAVRGTTCKMHGGSGVPGRWSKSRPRSTRGTARCRHTPRSPAPPICTRPVVSGTRCAAGCMGARARAAAREAERAAAARLLCRRRRPRSATSARYKSTLGALTHSGTGPC